jgi:uncharacterized protein
MEEALDSPELKVDVSGIMRRPFARSRLRADLRLQVGPSGLRESPLGSAVRLDLELQSAPDGVRVRGSISGLLPMSCTRCAAPFDWPLEVAIDEFFCRAALPLAAPGGEPAQGPLPEECYLLEGDHLDLNPMVNDQLLLSLPMRILCRENCRGLCSRCGADLNEEDCGCLDEETDPRLEKLRRWLDREDG